MGTKTSMNQYKTNMNIGIVEKPYEFIQYSMDDATNVERIFLKRIDSINEILTKIYKIPKFTLYSFFNKINCFFYRIYWCLIMYFN